MTKDPIDTVKVPKLIFVDFMNKPSFRLNNKDQYPHPEEVGEQDEILRIFLDKNKSRADDYLAKRLLQKKLGLERKELLKDLKEDFNTFIKEDYPEMFL